MPIAITDLDAYGDEFSGIMIFPFIFAFSGQDSSEVCWLLCESQCKCVEAAFDSGQFLVLKTPDHLLSNSQSVARYWASVDPPTERNTR
jgi:hypothetical protein